MHKNSIFWLRVAAMLLAGFAMVKTVTGQTITADTAYYEEIFGTYIYQVRETTFDDGSEKTERVYVGTTDAELLRHVAIQNEVMLQALANAVKVVEDAAFALEIADDRMNSAQFLTSEVVISRARSGAAALLIGHTWTSSEGDIDFSYDGTDFGWSIPASGGGSVIPYGTRVVKLADFPSSGNSIILYQVSPQKWRTLNGDYKIEY